MVFGPVLDKMAILPKRQPNDSRKNYFKPKRE